MQRAELPAPVSLDWHVAWLEPVAPVVPWQTPAARPEPASSTSSATGGSNTIAGSGNSVGGSVQANGGEGALLATRARPRVAPATRAAARAASPARTSACALQRSRSPPPHSRFEAADAAKLQRRHRCRSGRRRAQGPVRISVKSSTLTVWLAVPVVVTPMSQLPLVTLMPAIDRCVQLLTAVLIEVVMSVPPKFLAGFARLTARRCSYPRASVYVPLANWKRLGRGSRLRSTSNSNCRCGHCWRLPSWLPSTRRAASSRRGPLRSLG